MQTSAHVQSTELLEMAIAQCWPQKMDEIIGWCQTIRIDYWRAFGAELKQNTAPKAGLASTTIAGLATGRAVAARGKSEV